MVFSLLHWLPSALAAVLTIVLAFAPERHHRTLGRAMVILALTGLLGYLQEGNFRVLPLDFHTFHSILGASALVLSIAIFLRASMRKRDRRNPGDGDAPDLTTVLSPGASRGRRGHCTEGYAAAFLAASALVTGAVMLAGQAIDLPEEEGLIVQVPAASDLPEVEAEEFQGVRLTLIRDQDNNAIAGTPRIDREGYRLRVTGLVEREMNLTYDDLLDLPAYSETVYMPCVEGWGFYAKWTGFRATDLLNGSGLLPGGDYVLFKSADGYTTGMPLEYLRDGKILMAYGINDLTLPPERGFPLQVVAREKYGYKWGKWITEVQVVDEEVRGYWESRGYSNSADVGEFPFG